MKLKNLKYLAKHHLLWGFFLLVIIECITFSCRKEELDYTDSSSPLSFSTDTIFFDTVFATINAPVMRFTIKNKESKAVKISRVYIDRGESGYGSEAFRFNIDGDSSLEARDIIIAGKDSVFVFVRSGIPIGNSDLPFVIDAYLKCEVNKSVQSVYIYAYGQDAYYLQSDKIHKIPYTNVENPNRIDTQYMPYFIWDGNEIATDKPYVIFGYLTVPPGKTLTLTDGARLHFASNSGIWVQGGANIIIQGSENRPVLLSGIRLEDYYKNKAGQWGKVWIDAESKNNIINYAIIENGSSGIWLDSLLSTSIQSPGLDVHNTIIRNMTNYGIVSHRNSINGINLVISGCGKALSLKQGGSHNFLHCTFTNYGSSDYTSAHSLEMNDYVISPFGDKTVYPFSTCYFTNSIFYGNNSTQLSFDFADNTSKPYYFDHCLIRQYNINAGELFYLCTFNIDPLFKDATKSDFEIDTIISPAVGAGNPSAVTGIAYKDIKGVLREGNPTLGAYEFKAQEPTNFPFYRKRY